MIFQMKEAARISADNGKQPLDATLTAIAGINTQSNRFLAFTGADVADARPINGTVAELTVHQPAQFQN